MHLKQFQTTLTARLAEAGIDSPALDAKLLMQHALGLNGADLISQSERILSPQERTALEALATRRLAREPLAQIVGYKDFWRDRFLVSSDVLTPRPDSETLIEAMLEQRPNRSKPYHILDLGTGSGCLLLSLLREYPAATGLGIDQSEAALRIAQRNAAALGLQQRAFFAASDWMQTLQSRYDMIISNPPYIECGQKTALEPEVKDYEPAGALFSGKDGLDAYSHITAQLPSFLEKGAIAVIELGAGQAGAVAALADKYRLLIRDVKKDLAGIERAMVLENNEKD